MAGKEFFNESALKRGIEAAKKNIVIFEEAIQKERDTINRYYDMIEHNRKQAALEKEKEEHIFIERIDGDN